MPLDRGGGVPQDRGGGVPQDRRGGVPQDRGGGVPPVSRANSRLEDGLGPAEGRLGFGPAEQRVGSGGGLEGGDGPRIRRGTHASLCVPEGVDGPHARTHARDDGASGAAWAERGTHGASVAAGDGDGGAGADSELASGGVVAECGGTLGQRGVEKEEEDGLHVWLYR